MPVVLRYPLAVFALLALGTGCTHAQQQAAPAPLVQHVRAAVESAPAPVSLAAHAAPAAVKVVKPAAHRAVAPTTHRVVTTTVRHATTAARVTVARTTTTTATSSGTYPYASSTSDTNDAWGFTQRQCVSYVAWRLSEAGHAISNAQGWGNASNWDDTARRLGYAVTSTPTVGSVAQWNANESSAMPNGTFTAGGYGHVAYVTQVYADGSVQVSQYNVDGGRSYSSMHLRAPRYLHIA